MPGRQDPRIRRTSVGAFQQHPDCWLLHALDGSDGRLARLFETSRQPVVYPDMAGDQHRYPGRNSLRARSAITTRYVRTTSIALDALTTVALTPLFGLALLVFEDGWTDGWMDARVNGLQTGCYDMTNPPKDVRIRSL